MPQGQAQEPGDDAQVSAALSAPGRRSRPLAGADVREVAGFLAFPKLKKCVLARLELLEPAGTEGLTGDGKAAVRVGTNPQGAALGLGEAAGELGQVFLAPRGIAEQGQEHQRHQRADRIGFDSAPIVGQRLELFGEGLEILALGIAAGAGLFFHGGQRGLEVFGLETAAGLGNQFADEQALGLIVLDVGVALAAAPAVGLAQFPPAIGRIRE